MFTLLIWSDLECIQFSVVYRARAISRLLHGYNHGWSCNQSAVYAYLHFKCNDSWLYDQKTASKEDLQTFYSTHALWTRFERISNRFSCSHLTVKRSSLELFNLNHIFYGSQIRPIAIDLSLVWTLKSISKRSRSI